MTKRWKILLIPAAILCATPVLAADWKAVEKIETYAISGATGLELYESIGQRGPKTGIGRAIAYTDFKLTWTRDYQKRGNACVLASARPRLVITYRLPKPSGKLDAEMRKRWDVFANGVERHERVHGDMIKDLVREIESATVGLTVPNDPGCAKIRADMKPVLSALSQAQRARSRDFDRAELSKGGNVHQLVLQLVTGR